MSFLSFFEWLANTRGSIALHESTWGYPIVESVHVLSLCLFLGMVLTLDLRLLGASMRCAPVSEMVERLLPWTMTGFALMVVSGALLFYAIPVRTSQNVFFRAKVVMLILSGLNAWTFHRSSIYGRLAEWDLAAVPPKRARIAAGFSIVLWAGIVVAGRMIAYNWFDSGIQPH